jgi:hypothetical protein
MTKTARFLGTCLLIGSMTTVAWADGGETPGSGLASPSPTPAESTTDSTSPLTSLQDATVTSEVLSVLVTWFVQSIP